MMCLDVTTVLVVQVTSPVLVLIIQDADTNCFYYVQHTVQEPRNVLSYFKFNLHSNAGRGGKPSHAHSEDVEAEA